MQRYLTLLIFFSCSFVSAQQSFYLLYQSGDSSSLSLLNSLNKRSGFVDSMQISNHHQKALLTLQANGFLMASITERARNQDTIYYLVSAGKRWNWANLRNGNIPTELMYDASLKIQRWKNKPVNPEAYAVAVTKLVDLLADQGYPFASIWLDSFEVDGEGLNAVMLLDQGPRIVYDQLALTGSAHIKPWYLQSYLGMKEGRLYREKSVQQMQARLSQLAFIQVSKIPGIYFHPGLAVPVLALNHRKSSSIDGIVGVAPNSAAQNGEVLFTGEANVKIQNLFESGKTLDLNYRSFLGNSQDLRFRFGYPYVFRSQVGVDYELHLLRQDSNFLNVKNEFGLSYRFLGTDQIKFSIAQEVTSLLTVDTTQIRFSKTLPQAADMNLVSYNVAIKFTQLDYYLNPRKGYQLDILLAVGDKTIQRNSTIASLQFQDGMNTYNLYDQVNLRTTQYKARIQADKYFAFGNAMAFKVQINGGTIEAPRLFLNDLFRIGGLRTLKGFDEQSIFASSYLIVNTELRYLTGKNSNVMLFWNGATYKNNIGNTVIYDQPYGFGGGANLETGAGVFSLYYALGKAFNNPIEFSKGKVHFGLVNYF